MVVGALLISIILPPFAQAKQISSSRAESFQFRGRPLSVKSPMEQQVVLNKYVPQNSNLQPLGRNMGFSNPILNNAKKEFDLIREKSVKIFETVLDYAVQCYYKLEEQISQDLEDSLEIFRQIFPKTLTLISDSIVSSNAMNRRVQKVGNSYVAMSGNGREPSKTFASSQSSPNPTEPPVGNTSSRNNSAYSLAQIMDTELRSLTRSLFGVPQTLHHIRSLFSRILPTNHLTLTLKEINQLKRSGKIPLLNKSYLKRLLRTLLVTDRDRREFIWGLLRFWHDPDLLKLLRDLAKELDSSTTNLWHTFALENAWSGNQVSEDAVLLDPEQFELFEDGTESFPLYAVRITKVPPEEDGEGNKYFYGNIDESFMSPEYSIRETVHFSLNGVVDGVWNEYPYVTIVPLKDLIELNRDNLVCALAGDMVFYRPVRLPSSAMVFQSGPDQSAQSQALAELSKRTKVFKIFGTIHWVGDDSKLLPENALLRDWLTARGVSYGGHGGHWSLKLELFLNYYAELYSILVDRRESIMKWLDEGGNIDDIEALDFLIPWWRAHRYFDFREYPGGSKPPQIQDAAFYDRYLRAALRQFVENPKQKLGVFMNGWLKRIVNAVPPNEMHRFNAALKALEAKINHRAMLLSPYDLRVALAKLGLPFNKSQPPSREAIEEAYHRLLRDESIANDPWKKDQIIMAYKRAESYFSFEEDEAATGKTSNEIWQKLMWHADFPDLLRGAFWFEPSQSDLDYLRNLVNRVRTETPNLNERVQALYKLLGHPAHFREVFSRFQANLFCVYALNKDRPLLENFSPSDQKASVVLYMELLNISSGATFPLTIGELRLFCSIFDIEENPLITAYRSQEFPQVDDDILSPTDIIDQKKLSAAVELMQTHGEEEEIIEALLSSFESPTIQIILNMFLIKRLAPDKIAEELGVDEVIIQELLVYSLPEFESILNSAQTIPANASPDFYGQPLSKRGKYLKRFHAILKDGKKRAEQFSKFLSAVVLSVSLMGKAAFGAVNVPVPSGTLSSISSVMQEEMVLPGGTESISIKQSNLPRRGVEYYLYRKEIKTGKIISSKRLNDVSGMPNSRGKIIGKILSSDGKHIGIVYEYLDTIDKHRYLYHYFSIYDFEGKSVYHLGRTDFEEGLKGTKISSIQFRSNTIRIKYQQREARKRTLTDPFFRAYLSPEKEIIISPRSDLEKTASLGFIPNEERFAITPIPSDSILITVGAPKEQDEFFYKDFKPSLNLFLLTSAGYIGLVIFSIFRREQAFSTEELAWLLLFPPGILGTAAIVNFIAAPVPEIATPSASPLPQSEPASGSGHISSPSKTEQGSESVTDPSPAKIDTASESAPVPSNGIINLLKDEGGQAKSEVVFIAGAVAGVAIIFYQPLLNILTAVFQSGTLLTTVVAGVGIPQFSNLMSAITFLALLHILISRSSLTSVLENSILANIFTQKKNNILSPDLAAMSGRKKDGKSAAGKTKKSDHAVILSTKEQQSLLATLSVSPGGVGTISIASDNGLNALTYAHIKRMIKLVKEARVNKNIKVLVFKGAKDNFSAGGNIVEILNNLMDPATTHKVNEFYEIGDRLLKDIREFPKPTIVLAHGYTIGRGLGIAAAADFIVTDKTTKISMPEAKFGFFPNVGSTLFLSKKIGLTLAKYYGLTGAMMSGIEAVQFGLADGYTSGGVEIFLRHLEFYVVNRSALGKKDVWGVINGRTMGPYSDPNISNKSAAIKKYFDFEQNSQGTLRDILSRLEQGARNGDRFAQETLAVMQSNSAYSLWLFEFLIDTFASAKWRNDKDKAMQIELNFAKLMTAHPAYRDGVLGFQKHNIKSVHLDQIILLDGKGFRIVLEGVPTQIGSELSSEVLADYNGEKYVIAARKEFVVGQKTVELVLASDPSKKIELGIALRNSQWSDQESLEELGVIRSWEKTEVGRNIVSLAKRTNPEKFQSENSGDTSLNSNMSPELPSYVRIPLSRACSIFFYPRAYKAPYLYEVELSLKSIPQDSLARAPLIRMEEIKSEEELLDRLYRGERVVVYRFGSRRHPLVPGQILERTYYGSPREVLKIGREMVVEHFRRQWFNEEKNPPTPVTWLAWDPIQHLFELISFNETFKSLDIEKWGIREIVKEYLYSKGSHDKLSEILVDPTRVNMRVIGEYDPDKSPPKNASDLIALLFVVPAVTYLSTIVLAGFFGISVDANSLWGSAISAVSLAIVINEVGHMVEVNWKKPFREWSWPKLDTKGVIAFDDWPPALQKVLGFRITVPGAHGSSGIIANLVAVLAIFAASGFHWLAVLTAVTLILANLFSALGPTDVSDTLRKNKEVSNLEGNVKRPHLQYRDEVEEDNGGWGIPESEIVRETERLVEVSKSIRKERERILNVLERLRNGISKFILKMYPNPRFAKLLNGSVDLADKIIQSDRTPEIFKRWLRRLLFFMTAQYIVGTTVDEALQSMENLSQEKAVEKVIRDMAAKGIRVVKEEKSQSRPVLSIADILGEGIHTEDEANENAQACVELIEKMASYGLEPNISSKVTNLTPKDWLDSEDESVRKDGFDLAVRNYKKIVTKVREVKRAGWMRAIVWVDKEEYIYRDVANEVIQTLLEELENQADPNLKMVRENGLRIPDIAMVVQAYFVDSLAEVEGLINWMEKVPEDPMPIAIRPVKGAYHSQEVRDAEQQGDPIPVWMGNWKTDENYLEILRLLFKKHDLIQRIGIASHDVRTIVSALLWAKKLNVDPQHLEFQSLYGMTENLKRALQEIFRYFWGEDKALPRIYSYVPFVIKGGIEKALKYLMRRFQENSTANAADNNVNLAETGKISATELARPKWDPEFLAKTKAKGESIEESIINESEKLFKGREEEKLEIRTELQDYSFNKDGLIKWLEKTKDVNLKISMALTLGRMNYQNEMRSRRIDKNLPKDHQPLEEIRTIEDLTDGRSAFLKINWDIGEDPGDGDTKIVQTVETVKRALEKFDELFICTHLGRPRKEQLDDPISREKFDVEKKVLPIAKRRMTEIGIDAEIVMLPESIDAMPAAIESARKFHKNKKIVFMLPNSRFYPEESSYYTDSQPTPEDQDKFIERLLNALGHPAAYINEAIESHITDATVRMANHFPPEARAAGISFVKEVNKKLEFEAEARGAGLIIWGGTKPDKIYKHLLKYVSSGQQHAGDIMVVVGALAYPFLKQAGQSIGKSRLPKGEAALKVEKAISKIRERAQENDMKLLLPIDHRVIVRDEETAELVNQIGIEQKAIDIGSKTLDVILKEIDKIIERHKEKGEGWIIANGGTGVFERSDGRVGTRRLLEKLEEARVAGVPVFLVGGDMLKAVNEVREKDWGGRELNPAILLTTAGGTILASLADGISNHPPVRALLKKPESKTQAQVQDRSDVHSNIDERIKLILFDLDGTLYHAPEFEVMYREALVRTYVERNNVSIETAREVIQNKSDELSNKGAVSSNQLSLEFSISWGGKEIGELKHMPFDLIKPNPKLKEFLDHLKRQGYTLAIATNSGKEVVKRILQIIGIEECFDPSLLITRDRVKASKPEPIFYERVLAALGVSPSQIVYVGNDYLKDVEPAENLGVWSFRTLGPDGLNDLEAKIHEIDEAMKYGRQSPLPISVVEKSGNIADVGRRLIESAIPDQNEKITILIHANDNTHTFSFNVPSHLLSWETRILARFFADVINNVVMTQEVNSVDIYTPQNNLYSKICDEIENSYPHAAFLVDLARIQQILGETPSNHADDFSGGGNWVWLYELLRKHFFPDPTIYDFTLEDYNRKWAWLEDVISFGLSALSIGLLTYILTGSNLQVALQVSFFSSLLVYVEGHKEWIANRFDSRAPPQYLESAKKIARINLLLGIIQLIIPVPFWISFPLLLAASVINHYLTNVSKSFAGVETGLNPNLQGIVQVAQALGDSTDKIKELLLQTEFSYSSVLDKVFQFWSAEVNQPEICLIDFESAKTENDRLLQLRTIQQIEEQKKKNPFKKVQYLSVNKNGAAIGEIEKALGIRGTIAVLESAEEAVIELKRIARSESFSLRIVTTQKSSMVWKNLLAEEAQEWNIKILIPQVLDISKEVSLSLIEMGAMNSGLRDWAEGLKGERGVEIIGDRLTIQGVPLEPPSKDEEQKIAQLYKQQA